MQSLQGQFLVASPHLPDSNFFHTVVLMIEHSEEGALGVVLNRPASESISEVWQSISGEPCRRTENVREGGPVPGPPIVIHRQSEIAQAEILPGLYMSSLRNLVSELLTGDTDPLLLFIGYSGWGAGQLEAELEEGSWLVLPAQIEDVFADADSMWKQITDRIGRGILQSTLRDLGRHDEQSWGDASWN